MGAVNLHKRTANEGGLLLAGLEGSMRYNDGPGAQYSEREMWRNVYGLAPALMRNRMRTGRYLDVLMAHSPPAGIHDKPDLPHQGFTSFLALMRWFKPALPAPWPHPYLPARRSHADALCGDRRGQCLPLAVDGPGAG